MYSTCLFCNGTLGANEAIEHFPVGRRLAFDSAKGRLWVVCRRCERWNLTPLEERWEAIEECERAFGGTRLRVSTDEIGLARLREGLELVRIGAPQRPEMAAWRYGDQFSRRRTRAILIGGAAAVGVGGVVIAGPVMGLVGGGGMALLHVFNFVRAIRDVSTISARVPGPDGETLVVRPRNLGAAALRWEPSIDRWSIDVSHTPPRERGPWWHMNTDGSHVDTTLSGDDALRAARLLLPAINARGAGRQIVRDAVTYLEGSTDPGQLFASTAREHAFTERWKSLDRKIPLQRLPMSVRLALEMAAHEETERRALEGELHLLQDEWRSAEEVAAIADDMFLPVSVDDDLQRLRRGTP